MPGSSERIPLSARERRRVVRYPCAVASSSSRSQRRVGCRAVLLAALLLGCSSNPMQATSESGFLSRSLRHDGSERRYVVYVPRELDRTRPAPLVVFLNGAGECGTDGQKQLLAGLAPAIAHRMEEWPCLVLFPQKPDRQSAWEDWETMVLAQLEATRREFAVDPARIALTGLSQGGHGTWVLGARHPSLWCAIAPICGYGDPAPLAAALAKMPIWAFHGAADQAVPLRQSEALCAAVRAAGGEPKLTVYPGVGHNAWDKAYRDEKLAAWLLTPRAR